MTVTTRDVKLPGNPSRPVRLSVVQNPGMYGIVSFPPGPGGDKDAKAADHKALQMYYLVLPAAVLGSMLFVIVLSCIVTSRLRRRKQ